MPIASAPPQTSYALSDAGYVAYQTFGDGPNPVLFVPSWLQNLDVMWDEPALARYLGRLASFAKVLAFDKRGTGVSDPVALHALPTIEQWMDDARVALDAAEIDRTAVIGDTEGGPIAAMFAATYPERVTALVLVNTFARWRRDHDYSIGMPDETVTRLTDLYEQHWGVTPDILELTAPSAYRDPRFRAWYLRYQRLCMPRGAAAAMYRWVTDLDVRSVLASIHAPTLVVSRSDAQHHRPAFSRYLADHIPDAKYVELPGADTYPFQTGDFDQVLDQLEQFLTGSEPVTNVDRVLGTIVFTDIVASTEVVTAIGDSAWLALRRTHDDLVRESIRRHRGREISHTGDGFLALFDGPARAVTCAARIVEQVRDLGIEIRAGVHTGEVELIGDQIGGVAVHLASRILDEAGPGTILASSTVKDLVLGSGIGFMDRGPRQLKGVADTWNLFQVTNVP
ncbi:MAG TPA: adenylate/guanylate cyclase domain-containing protein [Acidimicrobiia bacterium]|nr:adenylate/guanylate cyclase domain-containing protein [Acidimicrobiia bacterium]